MKIDLQKAYDVLDWGFMQSLLANIGLKPGYYKWFSLSLFSCGKGLAPGLPTIATPFYLGHELLEFTHQQSS